MKARTKSILALSSTLLIGIVLGGIITLGVVRQKLDRMRGMRSKGSFTELFVEAAQPTAEQEAAIRPILDKYGATIEALHKRHKLENQEQFGGLKTELAVHLDEDQMKRIQRRLKWMKSPRKKRPGSRKEKRRP